MQCRLTEIFNLGLVDLPLIREITQEGEHVTKDHQDLKGVVDHEVAYPIHPTPAEGNGARERGHVITENLRGHETELVAWRDGNSIVLHRTFPGQSHQVWYIHTLADENTLLVHYEVEVDNRRVDSSSTFTRCE